MQLYGLILYYQRWLINSCLVYVATEFMILIKIKIKNKTLFIWEGEKWRKERKNYVCASDESESSCSDTFFFFFDFYTATQRMLNNYRSFSGLQIKIFIIIWFLRCSLKCGDENFDFSNLIYKTKNELYFFEKKLKNVVRFNLLKRETNKAFINVYPKWVCQSKPKNLLIYLTWLNFLFIILKIQILNQNFFINL